MTRQDIINKTQNSEDMLKCLYVSRYYYNSAGKLGHLAFFFAILSIFAMFMPNPPAEPFVTLSKASPILLNILIFAFYYAMRSRISKAAMIRDYFETKVLGFDDPLIVANRSIIQELVSKVLRNKREEFERQKNNSGLDDPPGVKDWYTFSKKYNDSDVVFECQKQNQLWNKRLMRARLIINGLLLGIVALTFLVSILSQSISLSKALLFGLGFFYAFIDTLIENIKYTRVSMAIDDQCSILEKSRTYEQMLLLQGAISERRKLRVVEYNFLHKRMNRRITKDYENGASL